MKIQLESYGKKYIVESIDDDLDIFEYLDVFKGLLVSAGFRESIFEQAIIQLAYELKIIKDE